MFEARVVVRYLDGRTLAGYGDQFLPMEAEIMVLDQVDEIHRIPLTEVKLVCFVKQFVTDSAITHKPGAKVLYDAVPGKTVELVFTDGERMRAKASLATVPKGGFFVTPSNPNSNNISIYVNKDALASFRFLD